MKKTLLATSTALLLLSACATQDDGDVLFSDTEKAIIKTLVYSDPPDDPTNAYDQNSAAATLGQKFFWDPQFSGFDIECRYQNQCYHGQYSKS